MGELPGRNRLVRRMGGPDVLQVVGKVGYRGESRMDAAAHFFKESAQKQNRLGVLIRRKGVTDMPGRSASTSDLVAAIADGDRRSFELLYRQYAPWLVARLRHRCADAAQVDDIVQETFVALWRACAEARQDEIRDIAGWLWRVASRRLVDAARAGGARNRLHRALRQLRGKPPERSAEDQVLADAEFGDVHDAMARLPPDLRDVVQATVLDGLSTREASELLRIPPGTVKTRAMRAKARLRDHIQQVRGQDT